jgi:hypothetical protein
MLEALGNTMVILSVSVLMVASNILTYKKAYKRGYGHGKHQGFSEGLWKAHERQNTKKLKDTLYKGITDINFVD